MSPEQLCGQTVDPRADQFSFCVALYEALYGERPFAGDNFAELRTAVLEGIPRPAPLSSRVPARVRAILLRGLSVVAGKRFPDMETLIKALEQTIDPAPGAGPHAGHRGRRGRAHVRARVRRRLAAARDAGAEVREPPRKDVHRLADGGRRPAPRRNSRGVSGGQRARRARALRADEPVARQLRQRLGGHVPAELRGGRHRRRRRGGDAGAAHGLPRPARRELGALADEFSNVDAKVVRKAVAATLALPPLDSCADARALKSAAPPRDEALRARVQSLRGRLATAWAMAAAGRDWQALKPMGALVDEARATGHEPLLAEALLIYARARAPFDPEGAEPLYEEAFKRGEAIHNDALAAEAAIQLVAIAGAIAHHFDVGERWARIADVTVERGVPLRVRGWFLHNRGTLFAAQGKWRLAEGDFTAAVAIRQQALGAAHPDLAASMINVARAVLVLGDPRRALETANRAMTTVAAFLPAESYEVGAARLVRGQALLALGRAAEARADMDAVLDTFERVLGRDHPFLADPLTGLGEVALAERKPADAQGLLERAWEIRSTHIADGGVREQTAFSLAQAIWDGAPADRKHALELAAEARDGYTAIPDLAPNVGLVDRWLAGRRARPPTARPAAHVTTTRPAPAPPDPAPPPDEDPARL